MTHYNIPVFVPHLGCPHDCVFCNQKKITGTKKPFECDMAVQTIEENLKTISKNDDKYVEIAFFGGSFTAIEDEIFKKLCLIGKKYIDEKKVDALRCSTRPDCIDEDKLRFMKECGFKTIELGVQSTDETVLLKSGRGHTKEDVFLASRLIKESGIDLGLQMMIGLPFDTEEKTLDTAKDLISLNPSCVRVYPTLTLEGTRLFDMYKEGEYTPWSLDRCIPVLAKVLNMFYENNINVVRVGLQTTDEINENTVIGPYHASIRELAESEIYKNKIEKLFLKDGLTVFVNDKEISKAIGNKKSNITYFKEKYGINIKICKNPLVKKGEVKV
ncbi:MAG: radical SAM protein [Ruminococcaceae bacterium]|nr:radical SAM protein [Oscillospiraceae bacterium]